MDKRLHLVGPVFILILVMGCSPKSGQHVLSFFFDGVPEYRNDSLVQHDSVVHPDSSEMARQEALLRESRYKYHLPYYKQECSSCHDNELKNKLLQSQPGLCYTCHANFSEKFIYLHGPVAGGYCTACHEHHLSEIPKLLKRKGQDLCLYCHAMETLVNNEAHSGLADMECTQCHDPHGGADRNMLK
ncbi:MAG: hypothetical protein NTU44_20580 [Bacteroidetes bacterium]|nr:hypothetical protein [Bacteroidota bacterium]